MSLESYNLIKYAIIKPDGRSRMKIEQIIKYPDFDRDDLINECYLDWATCPYEKSIMIVRKEVYKKLKRLLYHLQKRVDVEQEGGSEPLYGPVLDDKGRVYGKALTYFTDLEISVLEGGITRRAAAFILDLSYDTFRKRLFRKVNRFKKDIL